ncbi:adenosylcobinamide-GDP ribazoletransferase [Thermodesulfitimonas sp.]
MKSLVELFWAFLLAVQNLTRIPVGNVPFEPAVLGRGTTFFPVVGFLLGGLSVGVYCLAGLVFPPLVVAALLVALGLLLTGGMHVDGFIDAVDGLGGRDAARRLAIMRDSRVGAFGVMGGITLLLLRFSLFASIGGAWHPLLLAPVVSRWGMVWAIFLFPYARPQGQGRIYKDYTTWWETVTATVLALGIAFLVGEWAGLYLALAALVLVLLMGAFFTRHLGGLTGDTYGAVNEVLEVFVLAVGLAVRC